MMADNQILAQVRVLWYAGAPLTHEAGSQINYATFPPHHKEATASTMDDSQLHFLLTLNLNWFLRRVNMHICTKCHY